MDDLVSLWLSADDYRRLRRLAPNRMPTGDVDDLLENWLSDADVRRLAAKWCAEPSVHGGKNRPASARFVE